MQSVRRSCVLILSLLLFFSLCTMSKASESEAAKAITSSTLVEGTWSVEGTAKLTFTYRLGHKARHRTITVFTTETWTFNPDGTFTALDNDTGVLINGSWREKGKNVKVFFNLSEYDTLIEEALASDEFFGTVTITKLAATGTVGASTIRGTLTLKAHASFPEVSGTITATVHFAGSRTTTTAAAVNADSESKSLKAAVSELVEQALSSPEE